VITELSELRPLDAEQRFVEKMEALARLGGGVAQEFNNLLTAILATADLTLADPDLAASARKDLEDIREAGQRAATITRQLLAFSGSQSLSLRQTNINALLEQLAPLLAHVVPSNISLKLDLRASGAIEVDPARFEQVVLTLVMNSVDAMPEGGVLTVSTEDLHASIAVVVADSGRGMDEVTLARLFEPFHSTKGVGGGRGLGLASVYGTVRQLGGSVDIESSQGSQGSQGKGGGTRVRMFFPRVEAQLEESPAPAQATRVLTGGECVLVVEDERSVRAPICRQLRNLGYFVLEADHGEDALRVMQEHHAPIHLVISDVMMPEMDGPTLVGLLRSWYPRMRVLYISGYSSQYLNAQSGVVERHAFLAKPFSLEALAGRVREMLDGEWNEAAE
jgi:CheY-like chemotaxis protein